MYCNWDNAKKSCAIKLCYEIIFYFDKKPSKKIEYHLFIYSENYLIMQFILLYRHLSDISLWCRCQSQKMDCL